MRPIPVRFRVSINTAVRAAGAGLRGSYAVIESTTGSEVAGAQHKPSHRRMAMSDTGSIRRGISTLGAGLIAAVFVGGPAGLGAQAERAASGKGLEGTWRLQVTPYDCATGILFPESFPALVTYAAGGTSTGANGGTHFEPGQRSPEYGVWTYTGAQTYRAVREAFILFSSPGSPPIPPLPRGTQRIEETIEVDGASFESDAFSQLFVEGGGVAASTCARIEGERMR
jgi:hypothetical protein